MKIAKLELRHSRTGARINVNAADYAADIGRWRDYEIIREKAAGIDRDAERNAEAEAAGELQRRRRGEEDAAKRAQTERSRVVTNVVTEAKEPEPAPEPAPAPAMPAKPDTKSMTGPEAAKWYADNGIAKPGGWAQMTATQKRQSIDKLYK